MMKTMKSLFLSLLAAVLAISLCACGPQAATEPSAEAPTEPLTTAAPSTTEAPTEPPATEPETTEEWLPDGPVEPEVITAYSGTAVIQTDPPLEYTFSVPRIDLPGPYIEALNSEIRDTFYVNAQSYSESSYRSYVCGSYLTVIMTYSYLGAEESDAASYTVYTVNIEKCRPATREEILEAAGVTEEEFTEKNIAAQVKQFYISGEGAGSSPLSELPEEEVEEATRRLADGSYDVPEPYPFFGEDGSLCACGATFSPAGAGYFLSLVPLE